MSNTNQSPKIWGRCSPNFPYLHWFRRYLKKTRGGGARNSPPVGRGLTINLDCGSLIFCEQSLGEIKNNIFTKPLKMKFSKKLRFDQLSMGGVRWSNMLENTNILSRQTVTSKHPQQFKFCGFRLSSFCGMELYLMENIKETALNF